MEEKPNKLQAELTKLRARLEEVRLQGNLGKMELRDKLGEFKQTLDPAYNLAKQAITELTRSGLEESKRLAASLEAGWEELRKRHRELSDESEHERAREQEAKRKGEA